MEVIRRIQQCAECIPEELDAVMVLLYLSSNICLCLRPCTFGKGCKALSKGLVGPVEQVALPGQPGQGAGPGRGRCRSVSAAHEVHPPHAPHICQRRQVAVSALQHSESFRWIPSAHAPCSRACCCAQGSEGAGAAMSSTP